MIAKSNRPPISVGARALLVALLAGASLAGAQLSPQRGNLPDTDVEPRPEPVFLPVGVRVDGGYSVAIRAGEVQSTVVPPHAMPECPRGRLLVSDDSSKNPGTVHGFDLDSLGGRDTLAQAEPLPDPTNRRILSNDHDLVSLNDGGVLLIKMGQARTPLFPKPVWFDHAYKSGIWGPGARSVIYVWRSDDCGQSFSLRPSPIDTAALDDGWGSADDRSGGMPQRPGLVAPPFASEEQPIYQMGGTDGPLAKVDRATNRIFYTMGVVGNVPDTSSGNFLLTGKKIGHTMVAVSLDRGDTWKGTTSFFFPGWRTEVVPGADDQLAFAAFASDDEEGSSFIHFTTVGNFPGQNERTPVVPAPSVQGRHGWSESPWEHSLLYKSKKNRGPRDTISTNSPGQTILTRSPSSTGHLLALMDTFADDAGDGYRLYLAKGGSWTPLPSIMPLDPIADPDNFILHLTAIDLGIGPVLFYWYDVDSSEVTATIRGRLITRDDLGTRDFKISDTFDVVPARWYGDYHTAGGFRVEEHFGSPSQSGGQRYEYFPVWVQPDGRVHFARIVYTDPAKEASGEQGYFRVEAGTGIEMKREILDTSKMSFPGPIEEPK